MNPFMNEAIAEAKIGIHSRHGGPFGAVVVKDGKIVGRGHNQVILNGDPTCHGEMMAIRDACHNLGTFDLSGCEIYTTGEPCPMCFGAILWANIAKIYYGCSIADTDAIGFRDEVFSLVKRGDCEKELDREECLRLYEEYASMNGNTPY